MGLVEMFESLNVLCIDPSLSCTGLFLYDFNRLDWFSMSIKQKKETTKEEQLSIIYSKFISELRKKELAIIENYAFGAQSRSVTTCAEVGGVIRLALYHKGIPYIEIPSATWKKWSGFGKSMPKNTKKDVEAYIKQGKSIYNLDYKSPDEVDATMIYVACKNYLKSLDSGLRDKKVPECLIQLEDFVKKCKYFYKAY